MKDKKKKFKYWMINITLRSLLKLIKWLPYSFSQIIAKGLTSTFYFIIKPLQEIAYKNISSVYGSKKDDSQVKTMAKKCFDSIAIAMVDLLYYVEQPRKLLKKTKLINEEHLKEALSYGKGAIGVTGHLGNFPILFIALVQRGYKVNVIIRPMRNKQFSKFMFGLCAKWNINMITTTPRGQFYKRCLKALSNNELLFILADEYVEKDNGVEVDFFKHKVIRTVGPMVFHKRMDSPILPIFIGKDQENQFNIFVEKAINVEGHGEENYQKNIAKLTNITEEYIQKFPYQWGGWFSKKWSLNLDKQS
jgi:KDO2-lipid IV(A) lauroyltransferase